MENAIELTDIRQRFHDHEVLKGIDLKVVSGEIFGLLGPSGAGKTTLIKIMTGRLRQSGGRALLFGKEPEAFTGEEKKSIGMMMDDFGLYERLSCQENLMVFAAVYEVSRKRVEEILHSIGLWEARKRPVAELSKGMRIRLSLGRAVLAEPKLLFLDEPTSGLDPVMASEIHGLIQKEREKGATVFLTTHNMEEASKLCDHVALLHEGSIVEYGRPQEICRKYNHQHRIKICLSDGRCQEVSDSAAEVVADYLRRGMVETIHSTEPDLETVFMELTGRRLL